MKFAQHHRCCFGINHWRCLEDHQLCMLDVIMKVNQDEETNSLMEDVGVASNGEDENLKTTNGKQTLKRKIPKYYDRQQQMELVLAVQELSKFGNHELGHTNFDE